MVVRFTFRGLKREEHVRQFGLRCLRYALGRFAADLRDVEVILEDSNGDKGGIDKRCRISIRLRRGGVLQASVRDASCESALHRATSRLRRQLQAAVGERNQRKPHRLRTGAATT